MKPRRAAITTYRTGSTLWPFLTWALGGGIAAFFAERHALAMPAGSPDRWIFHGLCAAALLLGPISFGVHLARRLLVHVTLDPEQGLILADRSVVRWNEIEGIDHRPPPFRNPTSFLNPHDMEEAHQLPVEALSLVILLRSLLTIACHLLLPPLLLLSPWHPRVTVRLIDGRHLVYRDLERDGEFVFRIRKAIAR